jgi:hypothetical protein
MDFGELLIALVARQLQNVLGRRQASIAQFRPHPFPSSANEVSPVLAIVASGLQTLILVDRYYDHVGFASPLHDDGFLILYDATHQLTEVNPSVSRTYA